MEYSFEKLEVWNNSRELVKTIYTTTNRFQSHERFGLTNQIQRAIISVSSNIAKGSTRYSQKEQSRFYEIAYGSLIEVLNQLLLAYDLKYISECELLKTREQLEKVSWKLNRLYTAVKNKIPKN